jgi:ELWxxDGT repeat protein
MNPPSRTRAFAFSTLSALLASATITFTLTPGTAIAQQQVARLVKDTNRDLSPTGTDIGWVAPLPNGVVFLHGVRDAQPNLWISNGDAKTTRQLETSKDWSDSTPFPFGTGAGAKVAINRTGAEGTIGLDVWVADGTSAGAIFQPAANFQTEVLAGTTTGFFFDHRPWNQSEGFELYFSDGTVAGTHSLNPSDGVNPQKFLAPEFAFTDGAWVYFIANGNEIWHSDGTDANTTKVVTLPFTTNGDIHVQKAGQQMFISVTDDETAAPEAGLWVCPLAGGTVTHLYPQTNPGLSWVENSIVFGNDLVFTTRNNNNNFALWRTDGTVAGTRQFTIPADSGFLAFGANFTRWHGSVYLLVAYVNENGTGIGNHQMLYRLDSASDALTPLGKFGYGAELIAESPWREKEPYLYFYNSKPDASKELWLTKGDLKSTKLAKLPANHYLRTTEPSEVTDTSLGIFFAGTGLPKSQAEALYRAKGKKGATRLTLVPNWTASGIVDFVNQPAEAPTAPLYEQVGASLISFINIDDEYELWTMNPDGSKAKAIWKPTTPLQPTGALTFRGTVAGGTLAIFTVITGGTEPTEVWSTDGTKKGTTLIATHSELPYDFLNVEGVCYYSLLYTGLRKTDGTVEGTSTVSPVNMQGANMVEFQGNVWFIAAANGKNGLWRSDGTDAGTVLVKDGFHGISDELPTGLSVVGDKLVFWVRFSGARELWQSNGTTAGTVAITTPNFFSAGEMDPVADVDGVAVFPARKFADSYDQLFAWDATNGLRPLQASPTSHDSTYFYPWAQKHAVAGDQLFYTNYTEDGPTLWVTDGTDAGTHELVKPGNTNIPSPYRPHEMLAVGDQVYFAARNADYGYELWRSDGTIAGTVLVADVEAGPAGSSPEGLKVMDGKLYFNADRRAVGRELFVMDLPAN